MPEPSCKLGCRLRQGLLGIDAEFFFSGGGGGGNLYASNKAVQNRHNNVSYAIFFYCKYTVLNWGGGGGGGGGFPGLFFPCIYLIPFLFITCTCTINILCIPFVMDMHTRLLSPYQPPQYRIGPRKSHLILRYGLRYKPRCLPFQKYCLLQAGDLRTGSSR